MISPPEMPESSGPTVPPLIARNPYQKQTIINSSRCDCGQKLKYEKEIFLNARDTKYYLWLKGTCRSCGGRKDLLFLMEKGFDKIGHWVCVGLCILMGLFACTALFILPHHKSLSMHITSYVSVAGVAATCFWLSWKLASMAKHIRSRSCILQPAQEVK